MLILLAAASSLLRRRYQPVPADLPKAAQIEIHPMEIFYDLPRDTLYISLGGPRASIACELVGGILIRYVPKTNIIVGVTILNLSTLAQRPVILPVLLTMMTVPEMK